MTVGAGVAGGGVDDCWCRGSRWQDTVRRVKQFYIGPTMSMFSPEKQFEHGIYILLIDI